MVVPQTRVRETFWNNLDNLQWLALESFWETIIRIEAQTGKRFS